MKVSAVIPCYNEKKTIEPVSSAVCAASVDEIELIIVDDASNAGTVELLKGKIEALAEKVIYQPVNRGKGEVLRSGWTTATGDVVCAIYAIIKYNFFSTATAIAPTREEPAGSFHGALHGCLKTS